MKVLFFLSLLFSYQVSYCEEEADLSSIGSEVPGDNLIFTAMAEESQIPKQPEDLAGVQPLWDHEAYLREENLLKPANNIEGATNRPAHAPTEGSGLFDNLDPEDLVPLKGRSVYGGF